MINLKRAYLPLLCALAATLLLTNGCNLNPHPEPPFAEPTGPVTGSAGGGENNEVPGGDGDAPGDGDVTGDGDVAVDNSSAGAAAGPPNFSADAAAPSDAGATADAGAVP